MRVRFPPHFLLPRRNGPSSLCRPTSTTLASNTRREGLSPRHEARGPLASCSLGEARRPSCSLGEAATPPAESNNEQRTTNNEQRTTNTGGIPRSDRGIPPVFVVRCSLLLRDDPTSSIAHCQWHCATQKIATPATRNSGGRSRVCARAHAERLKSTYDAAEPRDAESSTPADSTDYEPPVFFSASHSFPSTHPCNDAVSLSAVNVFVPVRPGFACGRDFARASTPSVS